MLNPWTIVHLLEQMTLTLITACVPMSEVPSVVIWSCVLVFKYLACASYIADEMCSDGLTPTLISTHFFDHDDLEAAWFDASSAFVHEVLDTIIEEACDAIYETTINDDTHTDP